MTSLLVRHRIDIGCTLRELRGRADKSGMERARLATPTVGTLTRRSRLPIAVLAATFLSVLAVPAQAGLGDLLDPLVEDLPVVEDVVDPLVDEVVDPVVETIGEGIAAPIQEVVAPLVPPEVEKAVQPVVDEVLPPVDEIVPPVDEIEVPPVIDENPVPPIESITGTRTSDSPTVRSDNATVDVANENSPESGISRGVTDVRESGSLELAQSLQAALTRTALASPTVSGPLIDSSGGSWLLGLTDWLRNAGGGLVDLMAIPLRLLELLARALLTAGSGLVAPASLAMAFTLHAVRDRRWQGVRKQR